MAIDLSTYSTKELNALSKDIDKEFRSRRKQDEKKAREEMKEVAERYGLTLNEVVAGTAAKSKGRAKVADKYVHPEDPSKTWSGRGRKPAWIKEWEADGRSLDKLKAS